MACNCHSSKISKANINDQYDLNFAVSILGSDFSSNILYTITYAFPFFDFKCSTLTIKFINFCTVHSFYPLSLTLKILS